MKVVYILGLEHSGTTLTDQLLSSSEQVLGLGEVAAYFSESHMGQYHKRWGHLPDAYLCSCGESLQSCEFWQNLASYSGLLLKDETQKKYTVLCDSAKTLYGENVVLVDSSKSIHGLQNWLKNLTHLGLSKEDVKVVYVVKDARAFVASMKKKASNAMSVINLYRSFNYWSGANAELLGFLEDNELEHEICLYEELCGDTHLVLVRLLAGFVDANKVASKVNHRQSHIAIGNKNFIMRNRAAIKYDASWMQSKAIQLIYHLNFRAKKLNRQIYAKVKFLHRLL